MKRGPRLPVIPLFLLADKRLILIIVFFRYPMSADLVVEERSMRAVIILAGGQGSRMGQNKALAYLAGKPLIMHVLDRLRTVGDEFLVSIGGTQASDDYRGVLPEEVKVVQDSVDFQGPLAGFMTALTQCKSDRCFLSACDMPFVEPKVVEFLFDRGKRTAATVPRWESGRLEPLHAIYAIERTKSAASKILRLGARRMSDLISSLYPVTFVSVESEVSSIDSSLRTFRNLNTREDFDIAERQLTCR
jgi:molybdopterin-guanine dinucleotide biosynthesis protein A